MRRIALVLVPDNNNLWWWDILLAMRNIVQQGTESCLVAVYIRAGRCLMVLMDDDDDDDDELLLEMSFRSAGCVMLLCQKFSHEQPGIAIGIILSTESKE